MKKRKRLAAAMLSAILLCGFMPTLKGSTADIIVDEDDTLLSFDDLREMFPAGRYWNHMGIDIYYKFISRPLADTRNLLLPQNCVDIYQS